jgi:MFS family permease
MILGLGMGLIFAPAFGTATLGVPGNEAGVASAMVNTSQQVGGSVGTSLLSTLFASSAAAFARSHVGTPNLSAASMVHGYTTAFWWASGIFAIGLIVAVTVFPARIKLAPAAGDDTSPAEPAGDVSLATD